MSDFDFDTHLDAYLLGLKYSLNECLTPTDIHKEYHEKYHNTEYQQSFINALEPF